MATRTQSKVTVLLNIPAEARLRLRLLAWANNTSMSKFLTNYIDDQFEKQKDTLTPYVKQTKFNEFTSKVLKIATKKSSE
jgi:hypothetical protein